VIAMLDESANTNEYFGKQLGKLGLAVQNARTRRGCTASSFIP
jgi:hypothetical protein